MAWSAQDGADRNGLYSSRVLVTVDRFLPSSYFNSVSMPQPSGALPVKSTLSALPGPALTPALKECQGVDLEVSHEDEGRDGSVFKVTKVKRSEKGKMEWNKRRCIQIATVRSPGQKAGRRREKRRSGDSVLDQEGKLICKLRAGLGEKEEI